MAKIRNCKNLVPYGMFNKSIFFLILVFADVYNIVSGRGTVGRFCLFKSAYRIGEEIVGSFDFSDSLIICLKVNKNSSCLVLP